MRKIAMNIKRKKKWSCPQSQWVHSLDINCIHKVWQAFHQWEVIEEKWGLWIFSNHSQKKFRVHFTTVRLFQSTEFCWCRAINNLLFNTVTELKVSWVLFYRETFQEETGYETWVKILTEKHFGTKILPEYGNVDKT